MDSSSVRDLLASFSPYSDYFAIASADGRIKIWDTLKGQLQTEFADFRSTSDDSGLLSESRRGHLALDYKCMKWVQLESKKKKKHGSSLLVLGTGSGDVLAVEVSTGQLKWKVSDCHPGGVNAISFSRHNSFLYTAGVDGMICQIDCPTGSVVGKFRSSKKGISSLAISSDGNMLAAAAGLLKIFGCSDNKKIQKFSGHPVAVRCMIFSEDGKYILSSGVGERHIAIWKIDGGKKKGASCVLSMEHPAIFLDSRGSDVEDGKVQDLYVLALSEMGQCYFWYGSSVEELQNARPTKILLSIESSMSNRNKNRSIFAAKFDSIIRPTSALVQVAHGSLVKPSFEKLTVEYGVDMSLNTSLGGVLLPVNQSYISKKGQMAYAAVTILDSANAEDAILPLPKLHVHEKKRKHVTLSNANFEKAKVDLVTSKSQSSSPTEVEMQKMEADEAVCIEDRLRAAGLLDGNTELEKGDFSNGLTDVIMYDSLDFVLDPSLPRRKIRSQISTMTPVDACKMLELLVSSWKTRSTSSKNLLTWIYYVLVIHGQFITSQDSSEWLLDSLEKMTRLKSSAIHALLKLSGRLQLIMTQIDKAGPHIGGLPSVEKFTDLSEDELDEEDDNEDDDNEDVDEVVYGEDDESGSDD